MAPLYFEDLEVGQEWTSGERTVSDADVLAFAELTGDRSPVHLDAGYAGGTPFRRPIAHGLLVLSLASGLSTSAPAVRVQAFLGLREWHFRRPVYTGDAVRVTQRVVSTEPRGRGRRGVVGWQVRVTNQRGQVVQEGVTLLLVEARAGAPTADQGPATSGPEFVEAA